jgi:hypothetical protein
MPRKQPRPFYQEDGRDKVIPFANSMMSHSQLTIISSCEVSKVWEGCALEAIVSENWASRLPRFSLCPLKH